MTFQPSHFRARQGRLRKRNRQFNALRPCFSPQLEMLEGRLALSAAPIQVTTTADVVDPNDGVTSLREAIQQANSSATPQTIELPAGNYQLSAAAGELEISNSVTIEGAGAMSTFVDGGGQVRVFHIEGSNASVSFSGLTIQGGNASGDGGGILDTATVSQLSLTECMVNGNTAGGAGGGIDEAAGTSTLTLSACTIANNASGKSGGGIDIASNTTTAAFTNCTIYGNTDSGNLGGALADDTSGGTINLLNDTIDGNTSGLLQRQATFNLGNTIVAQNGIDVEGKFGSSPSANGPDLIGNRDNSGFSFLYALPDYMIPGIGGPPFGDPGLVGTASHPVDPRLGPLADNGGGILTQALLADSPAIGMGARDGAPDVDQRGVARPDGTATDIGAYEFAPPTPVITQATSEGRWGGSQPDWVGSQTLIVHGTGFYPDSILRVNGQELTTYFESPTELRAIVGDLMIKGTSSYSVTVFTPGGGESSAANVPVSADAPWLKPPTPPIASPAPVSSGPIVNPNPPAQTITPNEQFIAAVYHDLLKRTPDTAGMAFWTDFLAQGGSRSQCVSTLLSSREYLADKVDLLFRTYLHRSADTGATDYFVSVLAAGGSPQAVAAALVGSAEYYQAHGAGADGFIDAMFHDALGRNADSASLAFFEQELAAGASRQQVAGQIFASEEFRRDEVNHLYGELLNRQADAASLDHFAVALQSGMTEQQLIELIAASDEFFQDATS